MRSILLSLCVLSQTLSAQINSATDYPKGYFRNPLNIPISLAGNFGELRPNHYHMGLDIKTNRVQNYPVYAAADGYISRIKIEPGGFGRAIYINHPNGYSTLYAHLNDFFPALEEYVTQQQYNQETWAIYLELPPNLFPVKKGDFIAYSGTTGGSQAPHVHFEIRKTATDINLNPLLFGMPVEDAVPPVITKLAIYDRTKSVYEQAPKILSLRKFPNGWGVSTGVVATNSSRVSFAINAHDKLSGAANQIGIYEGILYDNDKEQVRFTMDNISYENTRNLNAHIDFKLKANGGPYLQHLSELPGYLNGIYKIASGDGVLDLSDGSIHEIKIVARDTYGNSSELNFKIQFSLAPSAGWTYPGKMFYPLMLNIGDASEDCEFYIGERGLYDSAHINYVRIDTPGPSIISATHSIGSTTIPIQDTLVVRIKPSLVLSAGQMDRTVVERITGNGTEVVKAVWRNGWAFGKFREFGSFRLVVDDSAPVIYPVGWKSGANLSRLGRLVIGVRDNLSKYKNFRGELDGKWLRFTNDKGKAFIYKFDGRCGPGKHLLKIHVEDEAGNSTEQWFSFVR